MVSNTVLGMNQSSIVIISVCGSSRYIQIRNPSSGQCVDSAARPEDNNKPAGLWPCHNQGGNQVSEIYFIWN